MNKRTRTISNSYCKDFISRVYPRMTHDKNQNLGALAAQITTYFNDSYSHPRVKFHVQMYYLHTMNGEVEKQKSMGKK